jgi:hypothetical protein
VPSLNEVRDYKQGMINEVDKLRIERQQNDDMVPKENPMEKDLDIVKSQILDLNDKFDYLIYLMIKNNKLSKVDK